MPQTNRHHSGILAHPYLEKMDHQKVKLPIRYDINPRFKFHSIPLPTHFNRDRHNHHIINLFHNDIHKPFNVFKTKSII
jgi:hypothetical protein